MGGSIAEWRREVNTAEVEELKPLGREVVGWLG